MRIGNKDYIQVIVTNKKTNEVIAAIDDNDIILNNNYKIILEPKKTITELVDESLQLTANPELEKNLKTIKALASNEVKMMTENKMVISLRNIKFLVEEHAFYGDKMQKVYGKNIMKGYTVDFKLNGKIDCSIDILTEKEMEIKDIEAYILTKISEGVQ